MSPRSTLAFVALCCFASTTSAQLVTPKTLPVAQGDQFMIFPTLRGGMGDVAIAIDDSLLDPFVNPAKVTRVGRAQFYGAPLVYNVSRNSGSARTLPIGTFGSVGKWSGGLAMAVQQLDRQNPNAIQGTEQPFSDRSTVNEYASGAIGRRFDSRHLSLGGSAYIAGLNAIDGVDFLYSGSRGIEQSGHMVDLRFGVTKEWEGNRTLDVILLHNRFEMTHDVAFVDFMFDPSMRQLVQRDRIEHNEDRTHTVGAHAEYQRPLASNGWKIGWLGTVNRLSHPKIPNYSIQSIPRDPGTSWAYNLGIGVSKETGPATFGMDVIYEPIWSNTWADAATDVQSASGRTLVAGEKTVENDFRFSNAIFRIGVSQDADIGTPTDPRKFNFQFGLGAHSISYRLAQSNHITLVDRTQDEHWIEWTPTWGVGLKFAELEVRYTGRFTTGVGRPGVQQSFPPPTADAVSRAGGILAAPSGPLTLQDVHVVRHQISFSVPMR
jgi:hypothetical protein